MGAPPFELQGRPRDKPITANARTKTANARPLNTLPQERMAARASHTSSPFPRHLRNAQTVFCSPRLKKEEPYPGLQHCLGGKRDRGEPLMLNVSVRPQPAAVAAVSALAATAGKTSSDEILVEQIAAGSKPAMQALFARHRTYVYRWLLRLVSNETLAEDLLSEVFLDVWRQAGRFQCRSSVSTWLMSIARHKALSARRRRTEAELDEQIEATVADPADDPEVTLQEKNRDELLRRALTRLPREHRE